MNFYFGLLINNPAPQLLSEINPMNEPLDLKNIFNKAVNQWAEKLQDTVYWNNRFDHFARSWSRLTGKPLAFNIAI
ncbi:MAG: hypothetical protein WAW61_20230, partial [Methylococcaceae bacterium]